MRKKKRENFIDIVSNDDFRGYPTARRQSGAFSITVRFNCLSVLCLYFTTDI